MFLLFLLLGNLQFQETTPFDLEAIGVYRPLHFAVSDQGLICLIDPDEHQLVFAPFGGRDVIRTGHKGEGPGEFLNPGEVYWMDQERVFLVSDYGNDRFSKWNQQGKLIKEFPKPLGAANPTFYDGSILYFVSHKRGFGNRIPNVTAYGMNDLEPKILWQYKGPKLRHFKFNTNSHLERFYTPWDPMLMVACGSDFLAVTYSNQNRVYFINFEGEEIAKPIRIAMTRKNVSNQDVKDFLIGVEPERRGHVRQNMIVPQFWPGIHRLFVDRANRVWLLGYQQKEGDAMPLYVFNITGQLLFKGSTPQTPEVIQKNTIYYYQSRSKGHVIVRQKFQLE